MTPSSFSSELMAWLMPDWVKLSASAALEKLPQETTFRNIWYLEIFIAHLASAVCYSPVPTARRRRARGI